MEREPSSEPTDATDATEATDATDATDGTRPRPRVDVSPALHDAGHEVRDLGFEGIPDSGPVVHPEEPSGPEDPLDFVNVQMPSD